MGTMGRLFGSRNEKRDAEKIAQAIVTRYQEGRFSGNLRVDDTLFADLSAAMPRPVAEQVHTKFMQRRARGDERAELLLMMETVIAIHDADHDKRTPAQPEPTPGPPSPARTWAKALNGEPITSRDEDEVLFRSFLDDKDV
jgi:hypothetical protein